MRLQTTHRSAPAAAGVLGRQSAGRLRPGARRLAGGKHLVRAKEGASADEVARMLEETNRLLNDLSGEGGAAAAGGAVTSGGLYCDESGCTIISEAGDSASWAPAGSMTATFSSMDEEEGALEDFEFLEGDGWKLGIDRAILDRADRTAADGSKYCGVVGSNSFTAAVTLAEYEDFVQLLRDLQQSVASSGDEWKQGASESVLEKSTERVWIQARAPNQALAALQAAWKGQQKPSSAFEVRFILTGGVKGRREVSCTWGAAAVAEVLHALDGRKQGNGAAQSAPAGAPVSVSQ